MLPASGPLKGHGGAISCFGISVILPGGTPEGLRTFVIAGKTIGTFSLFTPVIRHPRNAGDAHAAGAERSGAPKSVNLKKICFFRKIAARFLRKNRSLINPEKFSIAIVIANRK